MPILIALVPVVRTGPYCATVVSRRHKNAEDVPPSRVQGGSLTWTMLTASDTATLLAMTGQFTDSEEGCVPGLDFVRSCQVERQHESARPPISTARGALRLEALRGWTQRCAGCPLNRPSIFSDVRL